MAPDVDRTTTSRSTAAMLLHIIGECELPAGVAPALFRLEDGCLWLLGTGAEMGRGLGAAPSVLLSQARRVAVALRGGTGQGRVVGGEKRADTISLLEMAACAGIAPPRRRRGIGGRVDGRDDFHSTGGCSS